MTRRCKPTRYFLPKLKTILPAQRIGAMGNNTQRAVLIVN
jgi:hypothetical protein